ncbi:MAG: hypothetical protein GX837_05420 [Methanomicrobiales archaeon]|nr:hypothetical protein [Methanomicrobiales archaeon]
MTKYEIMGAKGVEKYLVKLGKRNPRDAALIIETIKSCLGEHLFDRIQQCDKKKMKGERYLHRLHVQRGYTVFYRAVKTKEKTFVGVDLIVTFTKAHQMYPHLDL